jgi:SAM-dependent methyltransferase
MSIQDRTRWEERHRQAARLSPRDSVLTLPRALHGNGLALDLACGQGRHSHALRRAGYAVVAMDVSLRALRRVRAATAGDHDLLAVQGDVDAWPFAAAAFDLIVQVDFLDRALFPLFRASLRSGGLLLIDTFLDQGHPNAEGPRRPAFLLGSGELSHAFGDFELLRDEEASGESARAVFLARKR